MPRRSRTSARGSRAPPRGGYSPGRLARPRPKRCGAPWPTADPFYADASRRTAERTPQPRAERLLGLLDCRQDPLAAAAAQEGPDLPCLGPITVAALDNAAVGNPAGHVDHAEAHGDRRVVETGFAPGLRQVALLELHRLDLVLDAAAGVGGKLFREIAERLRCREAAQPAEVALAVSGLDFGKGGLE